MRLIVKNERASGWGVTVVLEIVENEGLAYSGSMADAAVAVFTQMFGRPTHKSLSMEQEPQVYWITWEKVSEFKLVFVTPDVETDA